jgi:hypothetical protein
MEGKLLLDSFCNDHTFTGAKQGSKSCTDVLDERDPFVILSFCYDAKIDGDLSYPNLHEDWLGLNN